MPRPDEAHLAISVASDNLDNCRRQQLLGDLNLQANVQRQKGNEVTSLACHVCRIENAGILTS